jgi:actin-related protein
VKENRTRWEKSYQLPDGQITSLDKERFQCPESIFRPKLTGKDLHGIHQMMHESIMQCEHDLQKDLYCNIMLAGGNTMFTGIGARMHSEMYKLAPHSTKVMVIHCSERKYTGWIGGSIIADLSTFPKMSQRK